MKCKQRLVHGRTIVRTFARVSSKESMSKESTPRPEPIKQAQQAFPGGDNCRAKSRCEPQTPKGTHGVEALWRYAYDIDRTC